MATRSLNKVMLIGNLTRDPELRYTPQGTAVCNFGLATNRYWVTEQGEKKEDAEFHRVVSWNKLAELCSQLLAKGRKVYVEGRLQTRSWVGSDGLARKTTEIVISDMVILDSKRAFEESKAAAKTGEGIEEETEIDITDGEASLKGKQAPDKEKEEKAKEASEKEKEGEGVKSASSKKSDDKKKKTAQDTKEETASEEVTSKEEKVSPDEIPF